MATPPENILSLEPDVYQDWLEKLVLTPNENLASVLNETFVFIYSSSLTEHGSKTQSLTNTTSKSMIQLLNHAILRLRSTKVQLDPSYLTRFLTNRKWLWNLPCSSPVYTTLPLVLCIIIENLKTTSCKTLRLPNAAPLAEMLVNAFDWFRETGVAPTALVLVCQLIMLDKENPSFRFSQSFNKALQNLDEETKRLTRQWTQTKLFQPESLQKVKALGSFLDTLVCFLILPPLNSWNHPLQPYKAFFSLEEEIACWKNQLNKFLLNKVVWNEMRLKMVSSTQFFPSHIACIPLLVASHDPYTLIHDEARQHATCLETCFNTSYPFLLNRLFQYLVPSFNFELTQPFLNALQKRPLKSNNSPCTNDLVFYSLYKEFLRVARTHFVNVVSNDLIFSILHVNGIPMILNVLRNPLVWQQRPTTYLLETIIFLNDYFMFMSKSLTRFSQSFNSHSNSLNNKQWPLQTFLPTQHITDHGLQYFYESTHSVLECLIQNQQQLLTCLLTWKDCKDFHVLVSLFELIHSLIHHQMAPITLLEKCAEFLGSTFCLMLELLDTCALSFDLLVDQKETLGTLLQCMQVLIKTMRGLFSDPSLNDFCQIRLTRMKKKVKPFLLQSSLAKLEVLNLFELFNQDLDHSYLLIIVLVFQWDADNQVAEKATKLLAQTTREKTTFVSFFHEIRTHFYVNDHQQADHHAHSCQGENGCLLENKCFQFNGTVTYDTLIHCLCFAVMLAFRECHSSHASLLFFERQLPLFAHESGHCTTLVPLLFFNMIQSLCKLPELPFQKKKLCESLSHVAYLFLVEQYFHACNNLLPKCEMDYLLSILKSCYSDTLGAFFDPLKRSQSTYWTEGPECMARTNLCELLKKKETLYEWVTYQPFIFSVLTQNVFSLLACDVICKKTFSNELLSVLRQDITSFIEEMKDRPPMVAHVYFIYFFHSKQTLLGEFDRQLFKSFTQTFFQCVLTAFCGGSNYLHPYCIHILNQQIHTQPDSTPILFLYRRIHEQKTKLDLLKATQRRISTMLTTLSIIKEPHSYQTLLYYEELWCFIASLFKFVSDCQTIKEQELYLQLEWIPECCFQILTLFQSASLDHCFVITRFFKEIFKSSFNEAGSSFDKTIFFLFHWLLLSSNGHDESLTCTCWNSKDNACTAEWTEQAVEKKNMLKTIYTLLKRTPQPDVENPYCRTHVDLSSLSCIFFNSILGTDSFHPIVTKHLETIDSILLRNVFHTNKFVSLSSLRGLLCCIKAQHQNDQFPLSTFLKQNAYQFCLALNQAYQTVLYWKASKSYALQCPSHNYYMHFVQMFYFIEECVQLLDHSPLIFLFLLPFLDQSSKAFTLSLPSTFHQNYSIDFLLNTSFANIFLQETREVLVIFLYHENYEIQWATQRLCCQLFGAESLADIFIQPSLAQKNQFVFSKSRCFSVLSKNLLKFYHANNTLIVQALKDIFMTPFCWEEPIKSVLESLMLDIFFVYHECSKDFHNDQCVCYLKNHFSKMNSHMMNTYEDLMSAFRQAIGHNCSETIFLGNLLKYLNKVFHLYSSNTKVVNCCLGILYTLMESFEKSVGSYINEVTRVMFRMLCLRHSYFLQKITAFLLTIFSHLVKIDDHTFHLCLSNTPLPQNQGETCLSETLFSTFPLSKPLIEFLALHTTVQVLDELVQTFVTNLQLKPSLLLGELTLVFLTMINKETFQGQIDALKLDVLFTTLFPFLMQYPSSLKKLCDELLVRLLPFVSLPVLIQTLWSEVIDNFFIKHATDTFENVCLFRCKAGEILYNIYKQRKDICSTNRLPKSLLIGLCFILKHSSYASQSSWVDLWEMVGKNHTLHLHDPFVTPLLLTSLCQLLQSKFQDDLISFTNTLISMLQSIETKRGYKALSFYEKQNSTPTCSCSSSSDTSRPNSCTVCLWNHLSESICSTIVTRTTDTLPIPFIQVAFKFASSTILKSSIPLLTSLFNKTIACETTHYQGLLLEAIRLYFCSQCLLLELSECDVLCNPSFQSLQKRLEQQIVHQILTTNTLSRKSVTEGQNLDTFWSFWVSFIKLNEKFPSLHLAEKNSIDFLNIWLSWNEKNPVPQNIVPCTALTSLLWYLITLKNYTPHSSHNTQNNGKLSCCNLLTLCTRTLKSLILQLDEYNEDHAILTYLRLHKTILYCYHFSFQSEPMHPLVACLALSLHQNPTFLKDTEDIFYLCTKKMHFYRQNKKILDSILDLVLQHPTQDSSVLHPTT